MRDGAGEFQASGPSWTEIHGLPDGGPIGRLPGVRRNPAHELTEERLREDFAEMSRQAGIFSAVVLLQQAFLHEFDRPDAVRLVVPLDTARERGRAWLDAPMRRPLASPI